jgi:hypothetical protein
MIKWALSITLLLTACAVTGTAGLVDFASLGTNVYDIGSSTTGGLGSAAAFPVSLGSPLSGITFIYDDGGAPGTNGTAQISSSGVDIFAGSAGLNGTLSFLFGATPAIGGGFTYSWVVVGGMTFNFTLGTSDGSLLSVPDGAVTTLDNGDPSVTAFTLAGAGTVVFPGSTNPFNVANTTFTADPLATGVNISDINYTAPEPASFILIGTALLGLGCARRFSRRRS